jgi:O-antigen chain-terminating bifunctional methyltransferase/kinase
MSSTTLDELISQLPERYQPLYGLDSENTSRAADSPRTAQVLSMVDLVATHLGRPLRILDLGSAQGYNCFLAAERQHHVVGLDYLPINVAVSRAIHALHPELSVEFVEGDIDGAAAMIADGDFDLVLGLSVLHHIVHRDGHDATVDLVRQLRDSVPFGLFEMALREEPLYWADSLPNDPRVTLAPYEFIRELTWSSTHLSDVERPLLYCSRTHALVNGLLHPILRYAESSHAQAASVHAGMRRYYDVPDGMVKIAAHFGDSIDIDVLGDLQNETRQERAAIEKLTGSTIEVPEIFEFHDAPTEVLIAKTTFPGTLLSEVVTTLDAGNRMSAFEQVLRQLADLEALGWYHTDLRTWNVVWNSDRGTAKLIDHGALAQQPIDAAWPRDALYSFVVFAIALWTGTPDQPGLDSPRAIAVEIPSLPQRAQRLLISSVLKPRNAARFQDALKLWESDVVDDDVPEIPMALEWLLTTGTMLQEDHADQQVEIDSLKRSIALLEAAQSQTLAGYEALTTQHKDLLQSYSSLEVTYTQTIEAYQQRDRDYNEVLDSYSRIDALYKAARDALAETTADVVRTHDRLHEALVDREAMAARVTESEQSIDAMRRTISWRITRPLRTIRQRFR